MLTLEQKQLIQEKAKAIRVNIVKAVTAAKSGHPGGSLSIADVMSLLYFQEMNVNPNEPKDPNRDRFVLSKGHAAPALYATLAEKGFFPTEELLNLRKIDHILQGHPDMKYIPGVDMSTGSLGQGISAACGMALAGKIDGAPYRVFSVLGDGELEEGQVWEALLSASKFKLDNLTIIIDCNNVQLDGYVTDIKNIYPLDKKLKGFDLDVIEINGHKYEDIIDSLDIKSDKTKVILAKTIKGKGISFMENNHAWHGKAPNIDEYEKAIKELEEK